MSKIPEGATHKATNFYYRRLGPTWQLYTVQGWDATACDWGWLEKNAEPIEPQNPTWNGPEDGLPPVGLEVEVLWSSIAKVYVTGKILAHDGDRAVFRFTTGERKGEYQADKPHSQYGADLPNFRPIRTAEQLDAEERERVADEMVRRFALHNVDAPWKALFLQMYDCGVLKP